MSAISSSTPLQIEGLRVSYGDNIALDDVNLEVRTGHIHGLIGMNGSGKSTLFKSVMGLLRIDAGRVRLFEAEPGRARRQGRLAYTPQNEAIDWDFPISVRDVVMMGRYGQMGWRRHASRDDQAIVDESLARVELTELAERQIGALSGGQRKRAFLGRSLAQGAELLLLDEPFAGVDKRSETTITRLLRELADEGRTVLISTHDLVAVPELCDAVALINRRIIYSGPTAEALTAERLAAAFGGFVPAAVV